MAKATDEATTRVARTELARLLRRIEEAYPKASLMYARIAVALLDAPARSMKLSDLSEAVGKGRDSTGVQTAIGKLVALGMVKRELMPAEEGGRYYVVELLRK